MNFQLTTLASLTPGGSFPLTLSEEVGCAQGPFWTSYRKKKHLLPLPAMEPKFLGLPVHSPFTILTTKSRPVTALHT